jgi:hypothetical protein
VNPFDSTYGTRPHHYFPTEEQMTIHLTSVALNIRPLESTFDMCLTCRSEHLADCTCHERGID